MTLAWRSVVDHQPSYHSEAMSFISYDLDCYQFPFFIHVKVLYLIFSMTLAWRSVVDHQPSYHSEAMSFISYDWDCYQFTSFFHVEVLFIIFYITLALWGLSRLWVVGNALYRWRSVCCILGRPDILRGQAFPECSRCLDLLNFF